MAAAPTPPADLAPSDEGPDRRSSHGRDDERPAVDGDPNGPAIAPVQSTPPREVLVALDAARPLAVIDPAAARPDYRRSSFGDGWLDLDRNGCSTRNDVLARDLDDVEWLADRECTVASGILQDPYTGTTVPFEHDAVADPGESGSQAVQIDHIVSLSAAHAGGAWQWSDVERIAFANDPANLIAVDGPTNASKGDRGPADWMPEDPAYWCQYAADYASIAADYGLAVAADDKDMLIEVLTACA